MIPDPRKHPDNFIKEIAQELQIPVDDLKKMTIKKILEELEGKDATT